MLKKAAVKRRLLESRLNMEVDFSRNLVLGNELLLFEAILTKICQ